MSQSLMPVEAKDEVRIVLPWPDKDLSPNARLHWAQKANAARKSRGNSKWIVLATLSRNELDELSDASRVGLNVSFHPPDKRRRDLDNLIASMKAANDGISDALGVDDSRFISTYSIGEPVKGGAVYVTVREA
jgi:crossover junction endodeoxyribonuclease RusA